MLTFQWEIYMYEHKHHFVILGKTGYFDNKFIDFKIVIFPCFISDTKNQVNAMDHSALNSNLTVNSSMSSVTHSNSNSVSVTSVGNPSLVPAPSPLFTNNGTTVPYSNSMPMVVSNSVPTSNSHTSQTTTNGPNSLPPSTEVVMNGPLSAGAPGLKGISSMDDSVSD